MRGRIWDAVFWKKKNAPESNRDLKRQLETAGISASGDPLGAGIRLIRSGRNEFLPAWIKEFGSANVFVVSPDKNDAGKSLVFGPSDDKNYIAVFTSLEPARASILSDQEFMFPVELKGKLLLELAEEKGRGICINPTSEDETLALPASMMKVFLEGLKIC